MERARHEIVGEPRATAGALRGRATIRRVRNGHGAGDGADAPRSASIGLSTTSRSARDQGGSSQRRDDRSVRQGPEVRAHLVTPADLGRAEGVGPAAPSKFASAGVSQVEQAGVHHPHQRVRRGGAAGGDHRAGGQARRQEVAQIQRAAGRNEAIQGPTVDLRTFLSGRGVATNYIYINPTDDAAFGLQFDHPAGFAGVPPFCAAELPCPPSQLIGWPARRATQGIPSTTLKASRWRRPDADLPAAERGEPGGSPPPELAPIGE